MKRLILFSVNPLQQEGAVDYPDKLRYIWDGFADQWKKNLEYLLEKKFLGINGPVDPVQYGAKKAPSDFLLESHLAGESFTLWWENGKLSFGRASDICFVLFENNFSKCKARINSKELNNKFS